MSIFADVVADQLKNPVGQLPVAVNVLQSFQNRHDAVTAEKLQIYLLNRYTVESQLF